MPSFKSLDEASRWAKDHEAEHERLEDELRRKVKDDMSAAVRHVESLVGPEGPIHKSLEQQDRELEEIKRETTGQTKTLRAVRKEMRLAREERIARKALEQKKNADEKEAEKAFKRTRTRVLLALTILAGIAAAWATLTGKGH